MQFWSSGFNWVISVSYVLQLCDFSPSNYNCTILIFKLSFKVCIRHFISIHLLFIYFDQFHTFIWLHVLVLKVRPLPQLILAWWPICFLSYLLLLYPTKTPHPRNNFILFLHRKQTSRSGSCLLAQLTLMSLCQKPMLSFLLLLLETNSMRFILISLSLCTKWQGKRSAMVLSASDTLPLYMIIDLYSFLPPQLDNLLWIL